MATVTETEFDAGLDNEEGSETFPLHRITVERYESTLR